VRAALACTLCCMLRCAMPCCTLFWMHHTCISPRLHPADPPAFSPPPSFSPPPLPYRAGPH
jgi:hypothetical protein